MERSGRSVADRASALKGSAERRKNQLEQSRVASFPLAMMRRFKEIEGTHLALVISTNLFIAVIPLLIIGYAFIEAFNPNRSIGVVLVGRFHLTGTTADIVRSSFSSAKAGKNVALSISLVSLLITGLDISGTVGSAYARAFRMTPLAGLKKYLRGWFWLLALLASTSFSLTVRYWSSSRPWWFLVMLAPAALAVSFTFYLITPRLLLDLPFGWRALLPGTAISTLAAAGLNAVSTFVLGGWFTWYGTAYGSFGVALALMSWIGILAIFWVMIAAAQGVYWERHADTAVVLAMEQASEERLEEDLDGNDGVDGLEEDLGVAEQPS
ncbi:MAG: hypothetical protein RJA49_3131 [Actinomycetota bacterium]